MGGNIESGMMQQMDPELIAEFTKEYHERVNRLVKPEDRERRHDEGPPIFRVGETLELRGMRFEVMIIDAEKLLLMPKKG